MWQPPLVHSSPIFDQKLPIRTAHHTFLESRHPEFCQPTRAKQPFFLGSSSRTMLDCLYFLRYLAIWSLLNCVSCVPFMSVQFTDPRTHVSTCQCANCVPTSHWRANVPNCVRNFQLRLLKSVPIFQLFFKRIFQFLNFSIMLNICKFQKRSFGGVL